MTVRVLPDLGGSCRTVIRCQVVIAVCLDAQSSLKNRRYEAETTKSLHVRVGYLLRDIVHGRLPWPPQPLRAGARLPSSIMESSQVHRLGSMALKLACIPESVDLRAKIIRVLSSSMYLYWHLSLPFFERGSFPRLLERNYGPLSSLADPENHLPQCLYQFIQFFISFRSSYGTPSPS